MSSGSTRNGEWRIHVFPRAKHRPSFYFKEGDEKLLISPAAVELGGICTTPREQDFEKVTREHIVEMYQEVCVSAEKFAGIKARLAPRACCSGMNSTAGTKEHRKGNRLDHLMCLGYAPA